MAGIYYAFKEAIIFTGKRAATYAFPFQFTKIKL